MRMRLMVGLAVAGLGLAAGACSSTTDPYECADRGVFAPTCWGDVDGRTKEYEREHQTIVAGYNDDAIKIYEGQERQAGLIREAAALREELRVQSTEISRQRARLDGLLTSKRISAAKHAELTAELQKIQRSIDDYRYRAYTQPAEIQRVRTAVSTEVARASAVVEAAIN